MQARTRTTVRTQGVREACVRTRKYWNTKHERYETKEMLVLDKIGRVSIKSLSAIIMWPVMLGDDLARLECYVRGKDFEEYT